MKTIPLIGLLFAQLASARADIFLPIADGSVYDDGAVVTSQYVNLSGSQVHGDIQFQTFNSAQYSSILLELNPYALPLSGNPVSVYGYDNASGTLSGSDFGAGTYLGAWTLPANLGYGQETFFDVTAFAKSATGSFFGFELQCGGLDTFSSTGYNYGTPPELIATATPEPASLSLIGIATGIWTMLAICRRLRPVKRLLSGAT
jgi:hypothetical protein